MADNQAPATVPIPEGAMEQASAPLQTVAIPEGASLGAPTQANANVGGGAPLTEQDAAKDQANPGGSYASDQARMSNVPTKDPDHVRFKASDGSIHDVPKEQLTKAMQIDPKLQITDWPTQTFGGVVKDQAKDRFGSRAGEPMKPASFDPKTGALIGGEVQDQPVVPEGEIAGSLIKKGAGAVGDVVSGAASKVKSLITGAGKDASDQGLKDLIKTASGAKDPDVIDTIHSVLDKPKMFSTVENELKLAKPKLDGMKDAANEELENLRKNSTGSVTGAKQTAHQMFDDMVTKAKGSLKEDQVTQGIHDVRDFVTSKLHNGDMKFSDLNDVKREIADEIKKFDTTPSAPQVVNTLDKSQQEALKKARNLLETIEQQAEPASKAVNKRLSTLIDTTEALEKKFPHLDTAEKAEASHTASKAAQKKDTIKKIGITALVGGGGAAVGTALKDVVSKSLSSRE